MSRIAYVNGRYVPHARASVSIDDRGYQFADAVYEVVTVIGGRLVDEAPHLKRLARSLSELRIDPPMATPALRAVMREVLRRNRIVDGLLYLQVTRGRARRDHRFPAAPRPVVVMTARPLPPTPASHIADGVGVILIADLRWARRDIKSTSLLPNVIGKQQAVEAGAYEAWMVDADGLVTEGTASNAWIVTAAAEVVTRPLGPEILGGVTRATLLGLAREAGLRVAERPFSAADAKAADEAFLTSASSFVLPVTRIDGREVGTGRPGPVTLALRAAYLVFATGSAPARPAATAGGCA